MTTESKTDRSIKHSGADWMRDRLAYESKDLSPLGVKVANVLGQAYLGIYHIDSAVRRKTTNWGSDSAISVVVGGEVATFDASRLAMLVLCCQEAGLSMSVHGSWSGYTKLVFEEGSGDDSSLSLDPEFPSESLSDEFYSVLGAKKFLDSWGSRSRVAFSSKSMDWEQVQALVRYAHDSACRVSLIGRSPTTLEVNVSQRKREGSMFQRHPTMGQALLSLAPYLNIDFEAI